MPSYGKYGISRDHKTATKKRGIFYFLFFLLAIFLLLVLINVFSKSDVFKNWFSSSNDSNQIDNGNTILITPPMVSEQPESDNLEVLKVPVSPVVKDAEKAKKKIIIITK